MEILGERPAWSMNDTEKVSRLDATVAEINRLKTYYGHLVADLDASGYAKDIGAGDTARFLSQRYLIDPVEARRDLRLATALPKYGAVSAALPDPANPFPDHTSGDTSDTAPDAEATGNDAADTEATGNDGAEGTAAADTEGNPADEAEANDAAGNAADDSDGDGDEPTVPGRPLNLAQAAAIVSGLEKVPTTVPVENLQAAERQLVKLARTYTPSQLRDAATRMRTILDTDGPEPDENRAHQRESLTLKPADNGVKFNGYLANDSAELFRTLIHAGAKPHKTLDGQQDPRPRDKRQADALTDLLTIAAGVTHTTNHGPATNSTADRPPTKAPTGDRGTTSNAAADPRTPNSTTADRAATKSTTADPAATNEANSTPAAPTASADPTQPADAHTRVDGSTVDTDTDSGDGSTVDTETDSGDGSGSTDGATRAGSTGSSSPTDNATSNGYIPGHGPKPT